MSAAMRIGRCLGFAVTLLLAAGSVQGQEQDPPQLWADFNHYTLVARPDLANDAGQALLDAVDQQQLLQIVEGSEYADKYRDVLDRAQQNDTTEQTANQLAARIRQARIANARDEQRIARNIELLSEGSRRYKNAVERLSAAGQFAVPQMLATLRDPQQEALHPFVINALVQMGDSVLPPLTAALGQVEPVLQGQLAQVFARIGHAYPAPALKRLANNEQADPTARDKARRALKRLRNTANIPAETSAAELYLMRAQAEYRKATDRATDLLGYDEAEGDGIVWQFDRQAGLIEIPVPSEIFGDVLAMRSAKEALALSPDMKPALSLHLMANLRRENRLPQGASDPSYGENMRPASFYAMVAGPERLHDVLTRALDDADSALALDAIEALSKTAGTEALVRRGASRQPLVRAMSYPDQRVRFRAAQALANARPSQPFPAAGRVVPALAEAARPADTKYAAVLANTQQARNLITTVLNDMGYETFAGATLDEVQSQVARRAGVDMIVVNKTVSAVQSLAEQTRRDPRLAGAPLLAIASPADQTRLQQAYRNEPRVQAAVGGNKSALASAIEAAAANYQGAQLNDAEREELALEGLELLRQLAVAASVYEVRDVEDALINAIADERSVVAEAAGRVLAVLDSQAAQRALADQALAEDREAVKVSLLESLATSATHFGNRLNRSQAARLTRLVQESEGDIAVAAAEAHGALQLPTSEAVQLLIAAGEGE
jgi:hypothetical protein